MMEKLFLTQVTPDGTPRKLLNSKKLNDLGWESQISLRNGLEDT